jgi:hypothetical protein
VWSLYLPCSSSILTRRLASTSAASAAERIRHQGRAGMIVPRFVEC